MAVGMAVDLALQRSAKDNFRGMSSKLFPEEMEPGNRKENFTRKLEKERTWIAIFIASVGYLPRSQISHPITYLSWFNSG